MLSTSTDDRRVLKTLAVQFCVQRDGQLGTRQHRAGRSASADTCSQLYTSAE